MAAGAFDLGGPGRQRASATTRAAARVIGAVTLANTGAMKGTRRHRISTDLF